MSLKFGFDCCKWLTEEASDQEKKLYDKMCNFGEYFSDMIFDEETPTYKLIAVREGDGAEEPTSFPGLPDILGSNFTYNWFKTEIKELPFGIGSYDHERQVITVSPDHVEDDATLLHEMIHLHEYVINDLPLHYHDMLFWALYQDLRTKIDGLDNAINSHAHLLNETQLFQSGGVHDVLFLLKSFDLDMRMGYPFGKTFGYGQIDVFKDLKVIKGV